MILTSFFASTLLAPPLSTSSPETRVVEVAALACDGQVVETLEKQLALELPPEGVLADRNTPVDDELPRSLVRVRCEGSRVRLELEDAYTGKAMQRELVLDEGLSQSGITRTLALSIAEFVQASWLELELASVEGVQANEVPDESNAAPEVDPPAGSSVQRPVPTVEAREVGRPPVQPRSAWSLQLNAQGWAEAIAGRAESRAFGGGGLDIGVQHRPLRRLLWGVAVGTQVSTRGFDAGRILALTPEARFSLGYAQTRSPLGYQFGAQLRVGAAQIRGLSGEEGRESASFWGARVTPGAFVQVGGQVREGRSWLGLRVEAGVDVRPLRVFDADGSLLTEVAGARVGAGVYWRFELPKGRGATQADIEPPPG